MRFALAIFLAAALASAQTKPSARDLGVMLEGNTGPLNAITDVPGVQVGHRTLIAALPQDQLKDVLKTYNRLAPIR